MPEAVAVLGTYQSEFKLRHPSVTFVEQHAMKFVSNVERRKLFVPGHGAVRWTCRFKVRDWPGSSRLVP